MALTRLPSVATGLLMLAASVSSGADADPRLAAKYWGEPVELGHLGQKYSYFQTLSPDGQRMLVLHRDELWCVEIASSRVVWKVPAKGLFNAVYSPDGKTIATAQWENGANLLDAATGGDLAVFVARGGGDERPDQVGFLPDGTIVVHTYGWSYRELKDEPLTPDGSPRIASTLRYSLIVWDPATKKEVRRTSETLHYGNSNQWQWMKGRSQTLQTLHAWSERGVTVKQTLTHIDPRTGKKGPEITIDKNDERPFDMSPDGSKVLLVRAGDAPRLIDAATGELVRKLDGHRSFVVAGAYSPDGELIATVSGTQAPRSGLGLRPPDGPAELLIHNAETGALIKRYEYKPAQYDFTKVGFSPDGRTIWAVSQNHAVVLWGKQAFRRPGANERVGLPQLPEPPEPPAHNPFGGGYPAPVWPAIAVLPAEDTLLKLADSLPASGRTTSEQVDALFTAALGRLPTASESKTLVSQMGPKPTAEKLKGLVENLVKKPEFQTHTQSILRRTTPGMFLPGTRIPPRKP